LLLQRQPPGRSPSGRPEGPGGCSGIDCTGCGGVHVSAHGFARWCGIHPHSVSHFPTFFEFIVQRTQNPRHGRTLR
jgi:hypothetical protein